MFGICNRTETIPLKQKHMALAPATYRSTIFLPTVLGGRGQGGSPLAWMSPCSSQLIFSFQKLQHILLITNKAPWASRIPLRKRFFEGVFPFCRPACLARPGQLRMLILAICFLVAPPGTACWPSAGDGVSIGSLRPSHAPPLAVEVSAGFTGGFAIKLYQDKHSILLFTN